MDEYIDDYMNPEVRKKRNQGLEELTKTIDEMKAVWHNVSKLGFFKRRYFKKQQNKLYEQIGYADMAFIGNQLEATKEAYNMTKEKYGLK